MRCTYVRGYVAMPPQLRAHKFSVRLAEATVSHRPLIYNQIWPSGSRCPSNRRDAFPGLLA